MADTAPQKLYRARTDKVLMGLCGGLAKRYGWDATIVRIVFVFFEFATAGLLIFGYFLVALIVPKEPI